MANIDQQEKNSTLAQTESILPHISNEKNMQKNIYIHFITKESHF
jgi:hypothetical protein